MHTLLVIGGYGFFGQRLCAALAKHPTARVLIGGRDGASARKAALALGVDPALAVSVDAAAPTLPGTLRKLGVDTVIHTAGPFQGQDYGVANAAIETGCHYIDLADGRQFVAGIGSLDAAARARGVSVISGASSVPALSSAVVDHYRAEFARLTAIRIGISSGARAPGIAAVRGVFSYAGRPIAQLRDGSWQDVYGWRGLTRYRFPAPLGTRWFGYCDVPDLDLFPARYPDVRTVTFQAGFASALGHGVVWALAGLVQARLLPSLAPCAGPLNTLSRWIEPWVSHRGGMFVRLEGTGADGRAKQLTWHVIAQHNHGPFIPCGASIALALKLAGGERLPVGAMPCIGLLSLSDYLATLTGLDVQEIVT